MDKTVIIMNRYCLIIIGALVLCSCQKEDRVTKEIKEMYGRKITFVSGYESISYNDSLSVDSIIKKKIKIVSYIDDFPCTSCTFNMLEDWISTIETLSKDVIFLIILNARNKEELRANLKIHRIHLPVMYYKTDTFKIQNQLDVLARNRTFLLNQDDEIVLVGEPFQNKSMCELYKKNINKLKNKLHSN